MSLNPIYQEREEMENFPKKTISSDRIQATAAKYYEKILKTMLPLH